MRKIISIRELRDEIENLKNESHKIGFVPTMGALHQGHISLIKKARNECKTVICSIFVNPIQFNNPDDLKKYPRTLENDLKMLEETGCDMVFTPSTEEMYPSEKKIYIDLNGMDIMLEGKYRPGHFQGVAIVVSKLFDLVEPDLAYFGEKDFQQLQIIKYLAKKKFPTVKIIGCPTIREHDGLAMSSRNLLLSSECRQIAPIIYKSLVKATKQIGIKEINAVVDETINTINQHAPLKVEYFEIVDAESLHSINNWNDSNNIVGTIAVYADKVRLIDNIKFTNIAEN